MTTDDGRRPTREPHINCHVPITVRIVGVPTDDDLVRLRAAVGRVVAQRLREAARVIADRSHHPATAATGGQADLAWGDSVVGGADVQTADLPSPGAPAAGVYLVDSTAGRPRPPGGQTAPTRRPPPTTRGSAGGGSDVGIGVPGDWTDAEWVAALVRSARAGHVTLPGNGWVGLLYKPKAKPGYAIRRFAVHPGGIEVVPEADAYFEQLMLWKLDKDGHARSHGTTVSARSRIVAHMVGDLSNPQVRQRYRRRIEEGFEEDRQALARERGEQVVTERAQDAVNALMSRLHDVGLGYAELLVDDLTFLLTGSFLPWPADLLFPVVPYPVEMPAHGPGKHDGTSSGGQAGAGGTGAGSTGADRASEETDESPSDTATGGSRPRYGRPLVADGELPVCEPYLGEPPVSALGDDGTYLSDLIAAIARRLEIDRCGYAGQFCLIAAAVIRSHVVGLADVVGLAEGETENRADGSGNLGRIQFQPNTGANALLRRLAATVPLVVRLAAETKRVYRSHAARITGRYHGDALAWAREFGVDLDEAVEETVSVMFGRTCQILLLQLLAASRKHISRRLHDVDRLARPFFLAVVPELIAISELIGLEHKITLANLPGVPSRAGSAGHRPPRDPALVYTGRTATAVRDEHGRVWTKEQLQEVIALRRGLAEELEPLVLHIRDLPATVAAMRVSEAATRDQLSDLLKRMLESNHDITDRVTWSWENAVRYGQISADLPGDSAVELGRNLRGIHLLAHRQLVASFEGSAYYTRGVRRLFVGMHSIEVLKSIAELGVLAIVSVLCPPLGFVLGASLALAEYVDTGEKIEIRDALVRPDQLVDLAELDVEQFAATLGLVLALIPEAPSIIRGAYRVGAAALEHGAVAAGARAGLTALRRAAVAGMEKVLEEGFTKLLFIELAKFGVLNEIIGRALQPVLESVEAPNSTRPVGGTQGAVELIAWYRTRQTGQP